MTSTGSTAAPRAGAGADADLGRHPVGRSLAAVIRTYQVTRAGRPSPCRFQPSCSAYGLEAIERHGAARGSWLAVRRLSRCRPLGGKGWDPVPDARTPDRIA